MTVLLKARASVSIKNNLGLTPLHLAIKRKDKNAMEELVQNHADIAAKDIQGRTPLHHAVIVSAHDSFATERYLLDKGADINAKDVLGRTALHFAFVDDAPGRSDTNTVRVDPIEIVSCICAVKGVSLDEADSFGRSPLHYASQRSATICSLYLLARGAQLEREDTQGNTPLSVALLSHHPDYAIVLIQKQANVKHKVVERSGRVTSMFYLAVANDWQGLAYMMLDGGFDAFLALAACLRAGRTMLSMTLMEKFSDDKVIQNIDDKKRTLFHYASKFTQRKPEELIQLYKVLISRGLSHTTLDKHGRYPLHYACKTKSPISWIMNMISGCDTNLQDDTAHSPLQLTLNWENPMFTRRSIEIVQQLLSNKANPNFSFISRAETETYNAAYRRAIEQEIKRKAALLNAVTATASSTVLAEIVWPVKPVPATPLIFAVRQCSIEGVQLFTRHSASKILIDAVDGNELTALIHAVKPQSTEIVRELLTQPSKGATPNVTDVDGTTALMLALRAGNDAIVRLLLSNKADPNLISGSKTHFETPLIVAIQRKQTQFAKLLLDHGASPNQLDSQGNTPLILAIKANDTQLATLCTTAIRQARSIYHKAGDIQNINVQDHLGKTALHYVINPIPFASYENVALLRLLLEAGANPNAKDNSGHSPAFYAAAQSDGKLLNVLESETGWISKAEADALRLEAAPLRETPEIVDWFAGSDSLDIDIEADAAAMMAKTEAEQRKELLNNRNISAQYPVDHNFDAHNTSRVYIDNTNSDNDNNNDSNNNTSTGTVYDVLLTIVDVKRGEYGINNFYKLAIYYDTAKDMYILWTRWGRIGQVGQFQRTPMATPAEAVAEFEKIFKAKTGNVFKEIDKFEKKDKKYNLMSKPNVASVRDVLKPFHMPYLDDWRSDQILQKRLNPLPYNNNFEKSPDEVRRLIEERRQELRAESKYPPSRLPVEIEFAMKNLTEVASISQAMKSEGIDTDVLPLSRLSRDVLQKAYQTLVEIRPLLAEAEQHRNDISMTSDMDRARVVHEQIAELTSSFYELIPHRDFAYDKMEVFSTVPALEKKIALLQSLKEYEIASKILLGAHYRQNEINPLDYCYKAFGIRLQALPSDSDEYKLLHKYAAASSGSTGCKIERIFRLDRPEEAPGFEAKTREIPHNHKLLWHGSQLANYMGIFKQGLRIAPPEAPASGYMFGKGIYHADAFVKSLGYCRLGSYSSTSRSKPRGFMLLNEVALGRVYPLRESKFITALDAGYHATHGQGRNGPEPTQDVVFPNGMIVPLGELTATPVPDSITHYSYGYNTHNYFALSYHEYIVYNTAQVRMRYLIQVRQ
eukprot:TRINITY_DN2401_c0_g2_i2.p1 TRINITY_DN2401_c0_g2~~TRINITY_DN2401_c0_g2_i2.p1  ORF type:complete len:1324 (+),score=258.43 TRINITY_DN2401_c0_g2_i2:192-4163(+)